jgi:hypothetical protein
MTDLTEGGWAPAGPPRVTEPENLVMLGTTSSWTLGLSPMFSIMTNVMWSVWVCVCVCVCVCV